MSIPSKIVLWVLIITTVGGIGLWLTGGKKGEYSTAIQINAAPASVFPFLTEPEKLKTWMSGIVQIEAFVSGENENGALRRIRTARVVTRGQKEIRFDDEVIRFEQNEALSVQSSNANVVVTSIFVLDERDGGTYLEYRISRLNKGIGRIFAPLQQNTIQDQIQNEIRILKERIEASQ